MVYRVSLLETVGREKMRRMEERAVKKFGIPSLLMENAALAVAYQVEASRRVLAEACAFWGTGGDGLAGAALSFWGADVRVYLVGDPGRCPRTSGRT